jgi:cyclase
MKTALRIVMAVTSFVAFAPLAVQAQVGATDYTKATTSVQKLRGNLTLLGITTPQDLNNILILSGPEGLLVVDHPEPAAAPIVKKTLDELSVQSGGKPVKFLLNTHWHFDHVGGNEIYGPDATIVAQENVRTRMMTGQKPSWSEVVIGPYPEKAWPLITFENSVTIHFDSEEIEMAHYSSGHTDGDSVIFFKNANVVHVADIY